MLKSAKMTHLPGRKRTTTVSRSTYVPRDHRNLPFENGSSTVGDTRPLPGVGLVSLHETTGGRAVGVLGASSVFTTASRTRVCSNTTHDTPHAAAITDSAEKGL
jgi:hypothetical protein